mgnify:CR=1 FL=1
MKLVFSTNDNRIVKNTPYRKTTKPEPISTIRYNNIQLQMNMIERIHNSGNKNCSSCNGK